MLVNFCVAPYIHRHFESSKNIRTRKPIEHRMLPQTKLSNAQSGIGFDLQGKSSDHATKFVTSRTARVLLAGAGFLADAVSATIICPY